MARKHKRRKRRTHSHSVAAPRKRRKRVGAVPTIGSPKRRKHRHKMHGHKRRRRRMGASGSGSGFWGEFFGLTFGGALGMAAAEIGGYAIARAVGPGTGTSVGLAAGKVAVGLGTYSVGKVSLKNNSFVKGLGLGVDASAGMDGIRALQGMGAISGPANIIVEINDPSQRKMNPAQQLPANQSQAQVNAAKLPVVGMQDQYHEAIPIHLRN